jgi:pyrimidine deaminase RibD-like protein
MQADLPKLFTKVEEQEATLTEPVEQLHRKAASVWKAGISVGESWSGSCFGYHNDLHYGQFEKPPFPKRFNVEWGCLHGIPLGWTQRSADEVKAEIERRGADTFDALEKTDAELIQQVKTLRDEITMELSPLYSLSSVEREKAMLTEIEEMKWDDQVQKQHVLNGVNSSPRMTRDFNAINEGRRVPSHTYYEGVALGIEAHCDLTKRFWHYAKRLLKQLQARGDNAKLHKPASEAIAPTHKGIVEVERQSDKSTPESHKKRQKQLKALPDRILDVLKQKRTRIQMEELKEGLPDFSDLPDSDWYSTINDLLSDGMIDARVIRSGIYDAIGAAYNFKITRRGRALTPESAVESKFPPDFLGESDDRKFAQLAIEEARKSVPEDNRVHPKVGVVVVKDGRILETAYRGEISQCHAEYVALEKKLADVPLAGSTVYTTLEPCTSRNHPKVPCAIRLTERKVARVVIGMLDPDDRISGRGQRALRRAGIATGLFDPDQMTEIEELNRDFIREKEHRGSASASDDHDTSRSPVMEDNRRVQKGGLLAARPIIVPKRYGVGVLKDDMGYTGLAVINDGEPAYDIAVSNVPIKDGARLEFHRSHTERLAQNDGEAFYPAFVAMKLGGTFGSGLFDFMRERGITRLTVPITYRDFASNWLQTDVTLERDVEKSGGLRLGWTQKPISDPTSEVMPTSPDASSIVTEPAQALTRNVKSVLSVMTEGKNWKRTDLAKLANIGDDDALRALRALKDADKVIPIDVDEEPKGTFWRRI